MTISIFLNKSFQIIGDHELEPTFLNILYKSFPLAHLLQSAKPQTQGRKYSPERTYLIFEFVRPRFAPEIPKNGIDS